MIANFSRMRKFNYQRVVERQKYPLAIFFLQLFFFFHHCRRRQCRRWKFNLKEENCKSIKWQFSVWFVKDCDCLGCCDWGVASCYDFEFEKSKKFRRWWQVTGKIGNKKRIFGLGGISCELIFWWFDLIGKLRKSWNTKCLLFDVEKILNLLCKILYF